jgi:hypothetical protein
MVSYHHLLENWSRHGLSWKVELGYHRNPVTTPKPWIDKSWSGPYNRERKNDTLHQPWGFWRGWTSRNVVDARRSLPGQEMQISNIKRNELYHFLPVDIRDNRMLWTLEGMSPLLPIFKAIALQGFASSQFWNCQPIRSRLIERTAHLKHDNSPNSTLEGTSSMSWWNNEIALQDTPFFT